MATAWKQRTERTRTPNLGADPAFPPRRAVRVARAGSPPPTDECYKARQGVTPTGANRRHPGAMTLPKSGRGGGRPDGSGSTLSHATLPPRRANRSAPTRVPRTGAVQQRATKRHRTRAEPATIPSPCAAKRGVRYGSGRDAASTPCSKRTSTTTGLQNRRRKLPVLGAIRTTIWLARGWFGADSKTSNGAMQRYPWEGASKGHTKGLWVRWRVPWEGASKGLATGGLVPFEGASNPPPRGLVRALEGVGGPSLVRCGGEPFHLAGLPRVTSGCWLRRAGCTCGCDQDGAR